MTSRGHRLAALIGAAVLSSALPIAAQAQRATNTAALESLRLQFEQNLEARRGALYERLSARRSGPQGRLNADPRLQLVWIDARGVPRFYFTDNVDAAATVGTDDVWPGGATGYGLTGAGTALGELGVWDGNGVRTTHQEFDGRVTQIDAPSGLSSHATHVSGTMVAEGQDAPSKGMSYEALLAAYDWNSDDAEMAAAAAAGMQISNHSYGFATGWLFNLDGSGEWFWFGDTTVSTSEDYGFGFYNQTAADWDQIAFDAPFYTIVKSAGNDRNDFGPAQPDSHYVWDPGLDDWVWSMSVKVTDPGSGVLDGYDTVSWFGNAKNIMTVGAVSDIASGYAAPGDVLMSSFSGWGPSDDGRLKPDIVANGVSLKSPTASANNSYGFFSGTSMASPNAAGSFNLLVRHYEAVHGGTPPRSATLKAVVVHTAHEAGPADGPDYRFGWGLLNVSGAADTIAADTADVIREETLVTSAADEYTIQHPGGALRVTVAWTDPPGTPPAASVDPVTPMLVNDLDVRVEEVATTTVHEPWILDPANPADAATTGDNARDNVEQVHVASAPAGEYRVTVAHKGVLQGALQAYSIVGTGELLTGGTVSVPGPTSGVSLTGSYPNPFTGTTTIRFNLQTGADVRVEVFDLNGRRVRVLDDGAHAAGPHAVVWDGLDGDGTKVPAGIYFVRVDTGAEYRQEHLVRLD